MIIIKTIDIIAAKSDKDNPSRWLSFKFHSLDTAGIMEKLFDHWLSASAKKNLYCEFDACFDENKLRGFCRLIALLHDIGKVTPAFQNKISYAVDGLADRLYDNGLSVEKLTDISKSPHNIAGQAILCNLNFPIQICSIIGAHHGGAVGKNEAKNNIEYYPENYYGYKKTQKDNWEKLWKDWVEYSLEASGFNDVSQIPKPSCKALMILEGLLVMSDWIASNTYYFPTVEMEFIVGGDTLKVRIDNAWNKLGFPDCLDIDNIFNNAQMFENLFGFAPNEVQDTAMRIAENVSAAGVMIIEAPMGMGKTEAALAAARKFMSKFGENGLYFGLPTQATANGLFGRIKDWAGKVCGDETHTIRLAHGMAELNDEYKALFKGSGNDYGSDSLIVHEWFEGGKQALLSDFVIATVDQFLLASLKQRHVMLRHIGLAGKVVIIDECHAYDAYMNIYLDKTLTWMGAYKVPVILLSATLPQKRRYELVKAYLLGRNVRKVPEFKTDFSYPVITYTDTDEIKQEAVSIKNIGKDVAVSRTNEKDIIDVLSKKLSCGGCAAVIVNTVDYAQKLCEIIEGAMPDFKVICFHSRFISTDRAKIERELLELTGKNSDGLKRNKLIVVATQVLEQSLDVDFDFMITELCPMDLLLQRLGRLHRHRRIRPVPLKNAEISILAPTDEKISDSSKFIYTEWLLEQTEKYLPDKLTIPECIPYLVEKVYAEPQEDERGCKEYSDYSKRIQDKKVCAEKYCINSEKLNSKLCNSLSDFIDNDAGNDSRAERAVRDSDENIEVIAMRKCDNEHYQFISGQRQGTEVCVNSALSDEEALAAAREKLKLPVGLTKYKYDEVIKSISVLPLMWQNSELIKRECMLLLDENDEAEIAGCKLKYDKKRGLLTKWKESST